MPTSKNIQSSTKMKAVGEVLAFNHYMKSMSGSVSFHDMTVIKIVNLVKRLAGLLTSADRKIFVYDLVFLSSHLKSSRRLIFTE